MEHCRKTLVSKLHGIYSALNDNLSFGSNWVHPSILLFAPGNVAPIKASFSAAFLLSFRYCLRWGGEVATFSTDHMGPPMQAFPETIVNAPPPPPPTHSTDTAWFSQFRTIQEVMKDKIVKNNLLAEIGQLTLSLLVMYSVQF